MLRTGKQVWEANAKRRALTLRQEELDFYMQRYSILITQCSILAGFAFESIVHLEPPEDTDERLLFAYFAGLSIAVMCSLYVVVCGSCLLVLGFQLALLGSEGNSLEDAVVHLRAHRVVLFATGFTALFSLIVAAIAMAWIKMESAATFVTVGFAFTLTAIAITVLNIFCAIGKRRLVTGTAQFVTPDGYLDLATLQPQVANARVLSKYEDAPPEETL